MLSYVTVGAEDVAASGRFYEAVLVPLGYRLEVSEEGYAFSLPEEAVGRLLVTYRSPSRAVALGFRSSGGVVESGDKKELRYICC